MKKLILLFSLCFIVGGILHAGPRDPVAVLFQVDGKVEYSKKGRKWRKIRHSKFLFPGYQVRSGSDGSAKITIKKTGKNVDLLPSSHFDVTSKGLQARKGKLEIRESSGKLATGLMKRFSKSQTYTTVRRSIDNENGAAIDTARRIYVSSDYPYLVWENPGKKYSYRLKVGNQTQHVPASDEMVVRARVNPFQGTQPLHIDVLDGDRVIASLQPYRSRGELKEHTLTWVDGTRLQDLKAEIKDIKTVFGDNAFMLGSLFEKEEMWVAAMDQYTEYLQNNPDEIEMTPYLFRVYKKLKLEDKYKSELVKWQQAMK